MASSRRRDGDKLLIRESFGKNARRSRLIRIRADQISRVKKITVSGVHEGQGDINIALFFRWLLPLTGAASTVSILVDIVPKDHFHTHILQGANVTLVADFLTKIRVVGCRKNHFHDCVAGVRD